MPRNPIIGSVRAMAMEPSLDELCERETTCEDCGSENVDVKPHDAITCQDCGHFQDISPDFPFDDED